MLQAFVSLKHQQPPKTEAGLRSFFEALGEATLSSPAFFGSNVDIKAKPYTLEAIVEASMHAKCKFVVLQGQESAFWQATVLMPDKSGMAAIFFNLENAAKCPSVDEVTAFSKKVYEKLTPRIIRVGDSEAREKLKSRHGLVLMPGLGRIEWLQIVHPDVYSELYNPSELVAAPAYAAEIWEDGALFLRVYGDPKDWENEENISLANFIPGFLAGTANVKDGEKEKQNVRNIEKLWNRAAKTSDRACGMLKPPEAESSAKAAPKAAPKPEPKAAPKPEPKAAPKPEPKAAPKPEPKAEPKAAPKPEPKVEPKPEPKAEPKPEPKAAPKPEPKVEPKPEPKAAPKSEPKVEPKPEPKAEPKPEPKAEPKPEPKAEPKPEPKAEPKPEPKAEPKPEPKAEPKPKAKEAPKAKAPTVKTISELLEAKHGDLAVDTQSVKAIDKGTSQPLFGAKTKTGEPLFFAFSTEEERIRVLDKLEDFAAFLQAENFNVQDADKAKISALVKELHRPQHYKYIDNLDALPKEAAGDPRLAELKAKVKPPFLDTVDETHQLHLFSFNHASSSLEEILIRQFEDWPLTMEVKRHLLDLATPSAPEKAEESPAEVVPEEEGGRRTVLLVVLALILLIFGLIFVFVLDADINNLWNY